MKLYLGVDAGNSKTVAMLCAGSGDVLGVGRSGCGDIYGARTEPEAVAAVFAAIDGALQQAGVPRSAVATAAFRLAGVDWPEDRKFWDERLATGWPELTRRSILNDGYAAIRCGELSGVGVAVNAGTAGAVAARGPDGRTWDMGWWGQHALGALGLVGDALRAVNLAELGIGPPTALAPALLEFYGRANLAELNQWLTRRHNKATQAQRLAAAHIVPAVALAGDEVARRIVDEQGHRLALYAEVAARHVGLTGAGIPVILGGTVLMAPDGCVAAATRTHVATLLPTAAVTVATLPPVAGAALDAIAEAGIPVDADTASRIGRTLCAD